MMTTDDLRVLAEAHGRKAVRLARSNPCLSASHKRAFWRIQRVIDSPSRLRRIAVVGTLHARGVI